MIEFEWQGSAFVIGFFVGVIDIIIVVFFLWENCSSLNKKAVVAAVMLLLVSGALTLGAVSGGWYTSISPGTYTIEFVHQSGENVSIGIQQKMASGGPNGELHLVPYQFPVSAFVTPIKTDATELVVVKERGFKTLQLK